MLHFSDRTRRVLLAAAAAGLTAAAQTGCSGYYRVGNGYYGHRGHGLGHRGGYMHASGDGALIAAGIIGGILLVDALTDGWDASYTRPRYQHLRYSPWRSDGYYYGCR